MPCVELYAAAGVRSLSARLKMHCAAWFLLRVIEYLIELMIRAVQRPMGTI